MYITKNIKNSRNLQKSLNINSTLITYTDIHMYARTHTLANRPNMEKYKKPERNQITLSKSVSYIYDPDNNFPSVFLFSFYFFFLPPRD